MRPTTKVASIFMSVLKHRGMMKCYKVLHSIHMEMSHVRTQRYVLDITSYGVLSLQALRISTSVLVVYAVGSDLHLSTL